MHPLLPHTHTVHHTASCSFFVVSLQLRDINSIGPVVPFSCFFVCLMLKQVSMHCQCNMQLNVFVYVIKGHHGIMDPTEDFVKAQ